AEELLAPLLERLRREQGHEDVDHLLAVLEDRRRVREARILEQVLAAERAGEIRPVAAGRQQHGAAEPAGPGPVSPPPPGGGPDAEAPRRPRRWRARRAADASCPAAPRACRRRSSTPPCRAATRRPPRARRCAHVGTGRSPSRTRG